MMLVLEEAMRMAGEEKDFQKEKTEEVSEEEKRDDPEELAEDDAGENLRMNKVTEIIRDYIRENYMYDLSVQDLADKMNYSEPYFCRLFKQSFGQNFTAYLTEYRVSMAKKMLEEPTVNIKDIGKSVGYEDSNYLQKCLEGSQGRVLQSIEILCSGKNNLQASAWLNYNKKLRYRSKSYIGLSKIYPWSEQDLPL